MDISRSVNNLMQSGPLLREATMVKNVRVLASLLGPAFRGFIKQCAKKHEQTELAVVYNANFNWHYRREFPEMTRLYEAAKTAQWNVSKDIDWSQDVDPQKETLLPDEFVPSSSLPLWEKMNDKERAEQRYAVLSWLLSQFLHGEQGALYASAQVIEAVPWLDAKLYGSTQVVDEGRHVEAFHRYLTEKLNKLYEINDNLYVVIDTLMTDSRWDIKFLGMQIMIEGLALGAFGTIRQITSDPLLKEILKYVIKDEARHVHYGVLALEVFYKQLPETERRDREDLAFELSLLLRNRFLMHEVYDEYYSHKMKRSDWDKLILDSRLLNLFRQTMFRRVIPNLKRIGLLSSRIRPYYEDIGLLVYEHGKAAPELTVDELLK
ncbi:MAG: ferritin-like domain-containing protein [Acidobacteriota bacterium]|nr:ferritin-like domain-containing protein [Blastocatellia bacterium]MDW8412417.1 ferritin-like domain-containing protein [Acidobacteriota bacterium]